MTFITGMRSMSGVSDLNGGTCEGTGPMTWLQDTPDQVSLRQLRHHTKNALQRLLYQISTCPGLQRDPAGRALAHELERRIHACASLSDALSGLTAPPSALETRLMSLSQAVVELMADGDQEIGVTVAIDGVCPPAYDDVLVRVTHELVGNAVKHGMHLRLVGKIEVSVDAGPGGVALSVVDDGWGMCLDDGRAVAGRGTKRGEGLRIAALLAEQHGGSIELTRDRCKTVAIMKLPPRLALRDMGL